MHMNMYISCNLSPILEHKHKDVIFGAEFLRMGAIKMLILKNSQEVCFLGPAIFTRQLKFG